MTEASKVGMFSAGARKAQVGAAIAFLGALLSFLSVEGDWSWRGFAVAVVTGVVAALTVFQTTNAGTTYQGDFHA